MDAEVVTDLDEQGGGGSAVVGSDEVNVAEGVVGFVVGGEDDDAILFAGVAHDVVAHGEHAGRSAGGEAVGFEVAFGSFGSEVRLDEFFGFDVAWAADPAFRCGVEVLLREGVGGGAVEAWGGLL